MLHREVTIQVRAVGVSTRDDVRDHGLEIFERQLFGLHQQQRQELIEHIPHACVREEPFEFSDLC